MKKKKLNACFAVKHTQHSRKEVVLSIYVAFLNKKTNFKKTEKERMS